MDKLEKLQAQIDHLKKSESELRKMEKALRNAAQEWRTTFDGIRDAVCLLDTEGRILRCNRAMADLLGKGFNEIIGHLCHELVHGKVKPIMNCPLSRMHRSNQRETTVLRAQNKWFNITADPIFDDNGQIIGAVHIMADITDRKDTEQALQTEKAYLEQLFESAQEAIIMADNHGKVLRINKEFSAMFGYSAEEMKGHLIDELIVPESMKEQAESVTERVGKGEKVAFETIRRRKDASAIYVSVLASPIVVGNVQVGVYGIYRDITEQKKAEQALRKSEEEIRALIEHTPIGIYRTDPRGNVLMANPALVDLLGYDSFEDLSKQSLEQGYSPQYQRHTFKKLIENRGKVIGLESIWKKKDGRSIYVRESARAVFDEQGNVIYYEGMVEDITKRKEVEEELKENLEKLQKTIEGTVFAMSRIVETRDPYTAGHQHRVARLAQAIAKELALDADRIVGLRMAALVHDIGKIYVPAEILSRPTQLPEAEFVLIKRHPQLGSDILRETIEFPWPVADIVLQHHERINGSGYPQGLGGEDILREARILAVADVVEAMSSHRPYRPARGLPMTLKEIVDNKGILYDPEVVEVCLRLFEEKNFSFF